MRPWNRVEVDTVPGGGTMDLWERGGEFVIRVDNVQLMTSREHHSEQVLADLGCEAIGLRGGARVLVGGLGMGFTLARCLERLPADAEVVVAELVPAVVRWNEGVLGEVAGNPLRDPRTALHRGDVREPIRVGGFDAILLDVDNGPDALSHPGNQWLYGPAGLQACERALRPGGVLCVWSVAPDERFTKRLQSARFAVTQVPVRSRGAKGHRHLVWVARKRVA